MRPLDAADLALLDLLCGAHASNCRITSVKAIAEPSLARLRGAGLIVAASFEPTPWAMADWRARKAPPAPASRQDTPIARPKAGKRPRAMAGDAQRIEDRAPPIRTSEILPDIEKFLAAWGMSPTRFGLLVFKSPSGIANLRKRQSIKPATVARVREFIAGYRPDPATPAAPNRAKPGLVRPAIEQAAGEAIDRVVERNDRAHASRSLVLRRKTNMQAQARIDAGISSGSAGSVHVRMAQRELERVQAEDARLSCPIEKAKLRIRRAGHVVHGAEVTGGPAGKFVVGRKMLSKAELFAMAERLGR